MSNGNKQVEFNLEQRLNELNLTPSERANAIGAMRVAEEAIELLEVVQTAVKRVAGLFALKPSIRA